MMFGKKKVEIRGRKIVRIHFKGTCVLPMGITSFFQVMYHIKVKKTTITDACITISHPQ